MEAFEAKMERFGESIEHRVETQAAALEEKGDALCEVLQEANYAENKMQASIPGLGGLDLIDMRSGEMKM
jgi:predicted ArsR family transcriptional regulator